MYIMDSINIYISTDCKYTFVPSEPNIPSLRWLTFSLPPHNTFDAFHTPPNRVRVYI